MGDVIKKRGRPAKPLLLDVDTSAIGEALGGAISEARGVEAKEAEARAYAEKIVLAQSPDVGKAQVKERVIRALQGQGLPWEWVT